MSTIHQVDSKRIKGRIQTINSAGASNLRAMDMVEIVATVESDAIWIDCILCEKESYTKYRLLDEGLCELCRNRMINRLKLIINFE